MKKPIYGPILENEPPKVQKLIKALRWEMLFKDFTGGRSVQPQKAKEHRANIKKLKKKITIAIDASRHISKSEMAKFMKELLENKSL